MVGGQGDKLTWRSDGGVQIGGRESRAVSQSESVWVRVLDGQQSSASEKGQKRPVVATFEGFL